MKLRLKELRKARGWTQLELADRAGTTKSHISEIESGKKHPSNPLLERLTDTFGVPITEMLDLGGADAEASEILDLFRRLSAEQRAFLVQSARGLLSAQEK